MVDEKYKLLIEAETKSQAKILGLPIREKTFLEGKEYSYCFIITNLGKNPFPGGKLKLHVVWPTD